MRRLASLAVATATATAAALATGCRTAPAAPTLTRDWQALATAQPSFAALYRVDCCGQRGVLVTVRSGGAVVAVTVVVPPAGPRAEVWWAPGGGWLRRAGSQCRSDLAASFSELAALTPEPVAALLAGHLPVGGAPDDEPGVVAGFAAGLTWRAWLAGTPARVSRFALAGAGEAAVLADIEVLEVRGSVPGTMRGTVAGARFAASLVEWRGAPAPSPPAWLEAPLCAEER